MLCSAIILLTIVVLTLLALGRDEIKKINRDKVHFTERLKEAEGAQLRLEGELQSLRSSAATSAERHDSSLAQMEKRLQKAHDAVQAKQDEVQQETASTCNCNHLLLA